MDKIKRSNSLTVKKSTMDKEDKPPRVSLFARKEEMKNDGEMRRFNRLIESRKVQCHRLSQSLIDSYKPLTKREKVKVIEDMNESSMKRFKEYNDIFDQIKMQISDISNSLYESGNERPNKRTVASKESLSSSKNELRLENASPAFPHCPHSDDDEVPSENAKMIVINITSIQKNSKLLLNSKVPTKDNLEESADDSPSDSTELINRRMFIKARLEYKRRIRELALKQMNKAISNSKCPLKRSFNSRDFYYEPSITSELNADKKGIPIKYCNCIIV